MNFSLISVNTRLKVKSRDPRLPFVDLSRFANSPHWLPRLMDTAPKNHYFCSQPFYEEQSRNLDQATSIKVRLSLDDKFGRKNDKMIAVVGSRPETLVEYVSPGYIKVPKIIPRQGLPLTKPQPSRRKQRKNSTTGPMRTFLDKQGLGQCSIFEI